MKVRVCMGSRCMLFGAMNIFDQLEGLQELVEKSPELFLEEELIVEEVPCTGHCKASEEKVSPVVFIGDEVLYRATSQEVMEMVMTKISRDGQGEQQ